MNEAYLMVNAEIYKGKEVLEQLRMVDGVTEGHLTTGVYEIIAKLKAENMEELKLIVRQIRGLRWVRSTISMVVVD